MRSLLIYAITGALAGCGTPAPLIVRTGTLPSGPEARFVLADGGVDKAWLSAEAVSRCLESKGMLSAAPPVYLAHYAVAMRSAESGVTIGESGENDSAASESKAKPRGDRIVTKLLVDRLSNGARVYELSVDAVFKAKRSSQATRAADLCDAITAKAG